MANDILLWSHILLDNILSKLQSFLTASKDSARFFMIIVIYFYKYYYFFALSLGIFTTTKSRVLHLVDLKAWHI